MEMDGDAVKNEKRTVYLMVVPATILPLKSKDFKVESAAEENVKGKPAAALKVTGPDGKDFTLYFDKESGLPVRMVAKVVGFMGDEYTQDVQLHRLQGLRRHQEGHEGDREARRRGLRRAGDHRVQGARQGPRRDVRRAEVTEPAARRTCHVTPAARSARGRRRRSGARRGRCAGR